MALDYNEIEQLINKLRNRYRENAQKYNPRWFDPSPFEERLSMAIKNKMNMEAFILAEISNFEKLYQRYDVKKKQKENSFSQEVDRIIEEHNARIKKYPNINFYPTAGFEICHFYGAAAEIAQHYFPVLWIIASDSAIKNMLTKIEEKLNYLALPRGKAPSKRIEAHILKLARQRISELEIERDKNDFLKEMAFILHDIVDFCEGLMERREEEWKLPLKLGKLYIEDNRKKSIISLFSGHTGYGAILKVRDYCLNVIDDFRLKSFKKRDNSSPY